jgi:hypothetical protein
MLYCYGCPWIPQQNPEYENNLRKLALVRKILFRVRMLRFLTMCTTQEFLEYFYSPENMGGMWAIQNARKHARILSCE